MSARDPSKTSAPRAPEDPPSAGNPHPASRNASVRPYEESLGDFVSAVRRPFAFLAQNPSVTERTSVPIGQFVQRARALETHARGEARRLLEELRASLERFDAERGAERVRLARHCVTLLDALGGRSDEPATAGATASGGGIAPRAPDGAARMPGSARDLPRYRGSEENPSRGLERLDKSVQFLRGVGPRRAETLRKFGIETVTDLLYHLPFRYEDRRAVRRVVDVRVGETASVIGELTHVAERTVGRGRRRILEGVLRDETGLLGLTWYQQLSYFRNRLRVGQRCLVHGKIERVPGGSKRIVHPELDLQPDEAGQGILPVYNKPTTMTVAAMRKLVRQAVADFAPSVPSVLPEWLAREARVSDLETALRELHVPAEDADVAALNECASIAHRSVAFDEIFFLQLGMALRRRCLTREHGVALPATGRLTGRLTEVLPFELTLAQKRVIEEIHQDMAKAHPMHRLVQGDVGSGKTIVALYAALTAIENGFQAAFMAPTELLAEQHFKTVERFVRDLGVNCVLLTGEVTRAGRRDVCSRLADGTVHLVVGTHALIQEGVRFAALGIGIIDEQHRFGVLQRAALRALGDGTRTPDMLLMTATPIPRTLALTIYGDLDVSVVDELPPARKPVRTLLFNEAERGQVYQLMRQELERGHRGYVVYPLVETSEKDDLRDATTMAGELARTVFRDHRVGLVHGRMKPDQKDAVMRRFRDGDVQLLVSTTVIEVGVDVPDATVMVIEHAERFGLSQLHQLRGRVGRGGDRATCVLMVPRHCGEDVYRRLRAMAETNDGFRIAEIDLQLRGPGEFLGTRQSGLPDFRAANLIRDSRLLVEARRLAEEWLRRESRMSSPESERVRAVLQHRWAGRLGLAEVG